MKKINRTLTDFVVSFGVGIIRKAEDALEFSEKNFFKKADNQESESLAPYSTSGLGRRLVFEMLLGSCLLKLKS